MPYEIKWEPEGVQMILSGSVSVKDISRTNEDVFFSKSDRANEIRYVIWDGLEITGMTDVSEQYVLELAANDGMLASSTITQPLKFARVSDDEKIIQLIDLYIEIHSEFASNWTVKRFTDKQEALSWVH